MILPVVESANASSAPVKAVSPLAPGEKVTSTPQVSVPATPEDPPEVALLLAFTLLAFTLLARVEFGLSLARYGMVYVISAPPVRSTSASDLCVPVGSAALAEAPSSNMSESRVF
jgi:hypothetical protein